VTRRSTDFWSKSNALVTNAGNLNRARTTLAAFAATASHLANVRGRKTLVWGSLIFSLAQVK
jgi:hypothetical protein